MEWVAYPFSSRSSWSRNLTRVSCIAGSCRFLLQGIFPTQGLNLWPLHWQADSLPQSHQGSPIVLINVIESIFNYRIWKQINLSGLLLEDNQFILPFLSYFPYSGLYFGIRNPIWKVKSSLFRFLWLLLFPKLMQSFSLYEIKSFLHHLINIWFQQTPCWQGGWRATKIRRSKHTFWEPGNSGNKGK